MGVDWTSIIASGATVVAAAAAIASWRAAVNSNETSSSLARIELDRRHIELTPDFEVTCRKIRPDNLELTLRLRGPAGLDKLDLLKVSIRDNKRMFASPTGRPTEEEVAKQIWGPYRFIPNLDNASADGRSVPYSELKLGDAVVFHLDKTPKGSWMLDNGSLEWWETLGISRTTKISIYCEKVGVGSWTVPVDNTFGKKVTAIELL